VRLLFIAGFSFIVGSLVGLLSSTVGEPTSIVVVETIHTCGTDH
jgi:hypothetical protein